MKQAANNIRGRHALASACLLATAQDDKRDQNKPKVVSAVTLQVDPGQAEKIDLARSIGTLSLILRNPLDKAESSTDGARKDDLMAGESPAKPAAPAAIPTKVVAAHRSAPKPKVVSAPVAEKSELVEVIRGVQKANSNF